VLVCIACLDSMLSAGQVITNPCMHSSDENGSWMEVVPTRTASCLYLPCLGGRLRTGGDAPPPPGSLRGDTGGPRLKNNLRFRFKNNLRTTYMTPNPRPRSAGLGLS
jgi:hypothetical protein